MTRETRLGLLIAVSFLCLVGGVVTARLLRIETLLAQTPSPNRLVAGTQDIPATDDEVSELTDGSQEPPAWQQPVKLPELDLPKPGSSVAPPPQGSPSGSTPLNTPPPIRTAPTPQGSPSGSTPLNTPPPIRTAPIPEPAPNTTVIQPPLPPVEPPTTTAPLNTDMGEMSPPSPPPLDVRDQSMESVPRVRNVQLIQPGEAPSPSNSLGVVASSASETLLLAQHSTDMGEPNTGSIQQTGAIVQIPAEQGSSQGMTIPAPPPPPSSGSEMTNSSTGLPGSGVTSPALPPLEPPVGNPSTAPGMHTIPATEGIAPETPGAAADDMPIPAPAPSAPETMGSIGSPPNLTSPEVPPPPPPGTSPPGISGGTNQPPTGITLPEVPQSGAPPALSPANSPSIPEPIPAGSVPQTPALPSRSPGMPSQSPVAPPPTTSPPEAGSLPQSSSLIPGSSPQSLGLPPESPAAASGNPALQEPPPRVMPPPDVPERTATPPAAQLGAPVMAPTQPAAGNVPTPTAPPANRDSALGTVPNPNIAPSYPNTPTPTPPATSPTPVRTYDVDLHRVQLNETYAAISLRYYLEAGYARALEQYNLDRPPIGDRTLAQGLRPDMMVQIPPIRILREDYPNLVPRWEDAPTTSQPRSTQPNGSQPNTPQPPAIRPPQPRQVTPPAVRPVTAIRPTTNQPARPTNPTPQLRTYTTKEPGEYLREIARRELGSGQYWQEIWELNRSFDPSKRIPPGTMLRLPPKPRRR